MARLTMVRALNNGHQDCGACFFWPDTLIYWGTGRSLAQKRAVLPAGADHAAAANRCCQAAAIRV